MIVIDGKVVETPIKQILEMLRIELSNRGINKLNKVIYRGNNASITCPEHKDGLEENPSCSILLEPKGDICEGTVNCFTCGYKAGMVKFIADCLSCNYRDAKEWLFGFADYSFQCDKREIPDIDCDMGGIEYITTNSDPYRDWSEVPSDILGEYDFIHEYMFKRKLTEEVIYRYEIGYDPKEDALTFPVYVNGKCLFVAKRKVRYKRFDMPSINPKPIYGLDYCKPCGDLFVCESVINALTLVGYGLNAVALFGTGSDWQIEMLNRVSNRHIILALDGDNAGRNASRKIEKRLTNKIVDILHIPDGKDVNDLSREEFFEVLKQNVVDIPAQLW